MRDFDITNFRNGFASPWVYFRAGYKRDRPLGFQKMPPRDLGGFFAFYASSRNGLRFLANSAVVSDSPEAITGPSAGRDLRRVRGAPRPEVSDRRRDFAARVIGGFVSAASA